MAIPADVSTGTVTGTITDPAGNPASGSVTFTAEANYLLVGVDSAVILPNPVTVKLNAQGHFSTVLAATDDPDTNPTNFTYKVSFSLVSGTLPSYSIHVPTGSTQDLATLTPVASYNGTPTVVGPVGPVGPTGPQGIQGIQGIQGPVGPAGVQTVNHGTVAGTARPAGAPIVYWVGTARPTNALAYDWWYNG